MVLGWFGRGGVRRRRKKSPAAQKQSENQRFFNLPRRFQFAIIISIYRQRFLTHILIYHQEIQFTEISIYLQKTQFTDVISICRRLFQFTDTDFNLPTQVPIYHHEIQFTDDYFNLG